MMRRTLRRLAVPTTQADLTAIKKTAHANYAVSRAKATVTSTSGFVRLVQGATAVASERMTHDEAMAHLKALHAVGAVVYNPAEDVVHLKPAALLTEACAAAGVQPPVLGAPAAAEEPPVLEPTVAAKAQRFRQRFWGAVAVGSGTQMTVLAYLTFVTFGWDVMEPASYFVTSFTSLFFYLYYLALKREHSLQDVDRTVLPNRYAPKPPKKKSVNSAIANDNPVNHE